MPKLLYDGARIIYLVVSDSLCYCSREIFGSTDCWLQDNPADFSYFFDTSRRRTCYIAPERFVESSWRTVDPMKDMSNLDLTTSEVKKGDLTPSMDIFSAGSVSTTAES